MQPKDASWEDLVRKHFLHFNLEDKVLFYGDGIDVLAHDRVHGTKHLEGGGEPLKKPEPNVVVARPKRQIKKLVRFNS